MKRTMNNHEHIWCVSRTLRTWAKMGTFPGVDAGAKHRHASRLFMVRFTHPTET